MRKLLFASALVALGTAPALAQNMDSNNTFSDTTSPSISGSFDENFGTNGVTEGDVTSTGETADGTDMLSRMSAATRRDVEQSLSDEGFQPGDIDGEWDEQTTAALENFQEEMGLDTTGEIDNDTLSALGIEADAGTDTEWGSDAGAGTMTDMDMETDSGVSAPYTTE